MLRQGKKRRRVRKPCHWTVTLSRKENFGNIETQRPLSLFLSLHLSLSPSFSHSHSSWNNIVLCALAIGLLLLLLLFFLASSLPFFFLLDNVCPRIVTVRAPFHPLRLSFCLSSADELLLYTLAAVTSPVWRHSAAKHVEPRRRRRRRRRKKVRSACSALLAPGIQALSRDENI